MPPIQQVIVCLVMYYHLFVSNKVLSTSTLSTAGVLQKGTLFLCRRFLTMTTIPYPKSFTLFSPMLVKSTALARNTLLSITFFFKEFMETIKLDRERILPLTTLINTNRIYLLVFISEIGGNYSYFISVEKCYTHYCKTPHLEAIPTLPLLKC